MSWKETCRVNERERFVKRYEETGAMTALCREFGISRKTGYKWLERFYGDGGDEEALRDRSRRPHSHPKAVPTWLEEAIVQARRQRPHWGPKKLRAVLVHRNPGAELPAVSTPGRLPPTPDWSTSALWLSAVSSARFEPRGSPLSQ